MSLSKRILVVNLAGLGDIILASPAIKALRAKYSDSEIFLLTLKDNRGLIEACPYLTGFFLLQRGKILLNIKTLLRLRQMKFDTAVNLYHIHTWRGALKMWFLFCMIKPKASYGRDCRGKGFFFQNRLEEKWPLEKHDAEMMLDVVRMLQAKGEAHSLELWVQNQSGVFGAFCARHNIKEGDALIVLHPGATRKSHRWPARYFAKVAQSLAERFLVKIIITGTEQEKDLAEEISRMIKGDAINAAGQLPLPAFTELLKRASCFITNDTGPMHMANALEVTLVVISGRSPMAFLPLPTDKTVTLRQEKKSSDTACLKAILPEEAVRAAELLLSKKGIIQNSENRSSPVKVLHLHTRAVVGGSGTNALLTIEGLPKNKFCGHLACGINEAQDLFLAQARSKNITLHFIPHLMNTINPLRDALALFEIVRLIQKENYAIVHTHNSKAGVLGRLAAKICKTPVVIHTVHSCVFHYEGLNRFGRWFFLIVEKIMAQFTDYFIAISPHVKEEYLKQRIVSENKIEVIYSGIDTQAYKTPANRMLKRQELGLGDDEAAVAVVARLEKGKGHDCLFRAIPDVVTRHKNIKFLLIGEGSLRYQLEGAAKSANIEPHVSFMGLRSDVAEILKCSDIFCLPSFYEGMGRVILEAQASGTPVVATKTGGIPDIVSENQTAFLVAPKDSSALSQAILKLTENSSLREDMGAKAERFVDERFSACRMIECISELYEILSVNIMTGKRDG